MFCPVCGNRLQENESFCSKCGAKIDASQSSEYVNVGQKILKNFRNSLKAIQQIRLSYFGGIVLLFIGVFLLGSEKLQISYSRLGIISRSFTMFEDHDTWRTVFTLGYLAAVIAILLPLFTAKPWCKWNFLPGILIPLAAPAYVLVGLFQTWSKYREYAGADGLSIALTSNGWIFLLSSLVAALLAYCTSKYAY